MSFHPVSFQVGSRAELGVGWGEVGYRAGGLYVGGCGGVAGAGRLFCFYVLFFFSFCSSFSLFWLSLNAFNLFCWLRRLAVKPCIGALWGLGCQILLLRDKKETIHVDLCVCAHTLPSVFVRVCVWGMLMGVQKQQRRLLHHISTLFLGALLCKFGRKTSKFKVLSLHKKVGDKKRSKWQGVLIVLSALLLQL